MKISFVIPAYNEEAGIVECLTALKVEIARQPGIETEIIVANNASTDATRERALSVLGTKVIDEARKGVVFARQAGFEASTGELIANIDADTRVPEGWLTTVIAEFSADPALIALSGPHVFYDMPLYVRLITKLWYIVGFIFDRINWFLFKKSSLFQGGNYIVRRAALEKLGGYDTTIKFYGEDVNTGMRLNAIGKVKWTFALPINASGRRLAKNGIIKTGFLYATSFIWMTFFGKTYTQTYNDIRVDKSK